MMVRALLTDEIPVITGDDTTGFTVTIANYYSGHTGLMLLSDDSSGGPYDTGWGMGPYPISGSPLNIPLTDNQGELAGTYNTIMTLLPLLEEEGDEVIVNGTIEPLLLKATSVNTLSREVKSPLYPEDIIYYDWDVTNWTGNTSFALSGVTISGFTGVVTKRIDTVNKLETNYDFRKIKTRLHSVAQTSWMVGLGPIPAGGIVSYNSAYWYAEQENTDVAPSVNLLGGDWSKALPTDEIYLSSDPVGYKFNDKEMLVRTKSDYIDRLTFNSDNKNIKLDFISDTINGTPSICPNITFGSNCYNIKIGGSHTMFFDDDVTNVNIEDDTYSLFLGESCNNINIGTNSIFNSFGDGCSKIVYGHSVQENNMDISVSNVNVGNGSDSNYFAENAHEIVIGTDLTNSVIGDAFDIKIGNNCTSIKIIDNNNSIYFDGGNNDITIDSNNNDITIGSNNKEINFISENEDIVIGSDNSGMTISYYCGQVTIGSNNQGLNMGSYIDKINIGDGNENLILPNYEAQDIRIGSFNEDIIFGDYTYGIKLGDNNSSITAGQYLERTKIDSNNYEITFGDYCDDIDIGTNNGNLILTGNCRSISIKTRCEDLIFNTSCKRITINEDCDNITFGNDNEDITINNSCNNITFGNNSTKNILSDGCYGLTFPNNTHLNEFKPGVNSVDYTLTGVTTIDDTNVTHQISTPSQTVVQSYVNFANPDYEWVLTTDKIAVKSSGD
jgi:hypothetical protein